MSRPAIIRILLWIVLAALGFSVWQVLTNPDGKQKPQSPPAANAGQSGKSSDGHALVNQGNPPADGVAQGSGLLQSLPAPQSPPAKLSAMAKKQWLEDLMELIDAASYQEDEASLRMLIVEFRNPDPGIAAAARESLLARADKKALPYLLEMQSLDLRADKKRQLEEMVEFLSKPSVFEHMRSKDL